MTPFDLFIEPLATDAALTRRQRELAATAVLVERAFGPGAVKSNMPSGAPVVAVDGRRVAEPWSLSHSASHAVLVRGRGMKAIGVDIENFRPTLRRVVHKFLTPAEAAFYASDTALLAAWTLKEAAYKAAGRTGLPLHHILLPLSAHDSKISIAAAGEQGDAVKTLEILCSRAESGGWLSVVADYSLVP